MEKWIQVAFFNARTTSVLNKLDTQIFFEKERIEIR